MANGIVDNPLVELFMERRMLVQKMSGQKMLGQTLFSRLTCLVGMLFACTFSYPSSLFAQTSTQAGSPQFGAYSFLRNDANARSAALGGAVISIHDDPAVVFYNPAVIATVDEHQVQLTFFKHILDVNSGTAVYTNSLKAFGLGSNNPLTQGSVALSVNYINYGQFQRTDRNGTLTGGTFGGGDIAFAATYANQLDSNWYYGVSVKYINSRLENVSSGALALDAGMLYRIPKANVNIGVSVLHAGTQVATVNGVQERLPIDVRIGINHRLRGLPLLINASFARLADSTANLTDRFLNFQIGGEFYFGQAVRVRIGYDNQRRRELAADAQPRFTGFNAGFGLVLANIGVDYALSAVGMPGMVHRLSVNMKL